MSHPDEDRVLYLQPSSSDLEAIGLLLKACGLPRSDIKPPQLKCFLSAKSGDDLVGIIGLEVLEGVALVRSLAVTAKYRGRGIGTDLLDGAETLARRLGVETLYGLTETIEPLLLQRGFRRIDRDEAPEPIQATSQFSALCPESAVLLAKHIAR